MNELFEILTIILLIVFGIYTFGWVNGMISAIWFPIQRQEDSYPSKVAIGCFLVLFNLLTALGLSILMNPSVAPIMQYEILSPTVRSPRDQKNVFVFRVERNGARTQEAIIGEKVYFAKW